MAIVGTITAWMSSFLSRLWCFQHLKNLLEDKPLLLVMTALFTASSVALAADGIAPREFQNPDANLAAFWFLNDALQTDEMDRQLRAMKQAGFHSVVFHPRFGLGGDWGKELDYYLSDDYFQKVKFGLDVCQEIGLKVILYDEYNWPSGYAGGRVLLGGRVGDRTVEANPEYIAKHLAMEEADADGGQVFSRQVPAGELVAVLAVPVRETAACIYRSRQMCPPAWPTTNCSGTRRWASGADVLCRSRYLSHGKSEPAGLHESRRDGQVYLGNPRRVLPPVP